MLGCEENNLRIVVLGLLCCRNAYSKTVNQRLEATEKRLKKNRRKSE